MSFRRSACTPMAVVNSSAAAISCLNVIMAIPVSEREQRAQEESVEPAWLTGIGKRPCTGICDARIGHASGRHGVVGGDVIGTDEARNTHQLVTGVERHPFL